MKKIIGLFLILFVAAYGFAQSGIEFKTEGWEDALAEAKKSDKLIFLDAYTSWCGPCKAMAKNVFPVEEVADFYNQNFVNVKLDMEKGEGITVAETYSVRMYPSLLFVNGYGDIVHRSVGYHDVAQFVDLGKEALNPASQLMTLAARYEKGERNQELLKSYTRACYNTYEGGHGKLAMQYLETQDDWSTADNMEFLIQYVEEADTKPYKYLIANRAAFNEMFGEERVSNRIKNMVQSAVFSGQGEPISLSDVDRYYAEAFGADAGQHSSEFRMMYYQRARDFANYASQAVEHYGKYDAKHWNELNGVAWTFFEVVEDKKMLKKALKWGKASVKMDNNVYNNDTVAALLYKLGKKGKAKKQAEYTIELAKAEGIDYSETANLLEKIKAM
ncbi:MAG: thioredoxin family protein [Bacteroidota bacterium]